ncbi:MULTISPECIES: Rossmann-like and DUF2520 domain-containing protein [unclassified Ruminococcus]|uniref:Rossmann-like and DUF2520 domain-containing protein n=1 Tax=unclassified Ruminococcus TaxID=2608920 RepID=UPI00210E801C|nr:MULTISPECIES: Rossmann-like and DUF2520 domain-containing protein [unclassified Ruminococcus]MCQ4022323.1 DUF2520 domain-containing protein [Ruminococcus sp. zg-924]MCQ4114651.1 DUF2520 domain-containing protein [Ruminococcus sp. zg-921]
MNIGIIGAGKVGFSIGRFLADNNIHIVGYYDTNNQNAAAAAEFTGTDSFDDLSETVKLSDTLFITTPDSEIAKAWDCIKKMPVRDKIICHFSGSLSSDVFSGAKEAGAKACSVHPMLAFSNRYSSYKSLSNAFFTAEGDEGAVSEMESLLTSLGSIVCRIDKGSKALYHTAASVLSNHMVALLDLGYSLLERCGFSRAEAIKATNSLVKGNLQNVLDSGCVNALTGPIERGDTQTVAKHLRCLDGNDKLIYTALAQRILSLSKIKNKDRDYGEINELLKHNMPICELTEENK